MSSCSFLKSLLFFQGHCLAYEHGSSACDGLAVNPEKSWRHAGDSSAWPNRQHATSPNGVTGGASPNLSRNLALLLIAAFVSLWPLTMTTRAAA